MFEGKHLIIRHKCGFPKLHVGPKLDPLWYLRGALTGLPGYQISLASSAKWPNSTACLKVSTLLYATNVVFPN